MTSYNQYKNYHYLLEIEKRLEILLSKSVKDMIFKYKGNDYSNFYLEDNDVKWRVKIKNEALKFDMYNKKNNKWSNGDIFFSFNYNTQTNTGIGTTIQLVDIGVYACHSLIAF